MNRSLVTSCLFLISSVSALANPVIPVKRAPYNGYGVPEVRETDPRAERYLEEFLTSQGTTVEKKIYSDSDKGSAYFLEGDALDIEIDEIWRIRNDTKGLGLRRWKDVESVFFHNTDQMQMTRAYGEGDLKKNSVNQHLQEYTKTHGCIPKVNLVGHGWASLDKKTGAIKPDGHGLPSYSIDEMKKLKKLTKKPKFFGKKKGAKVKFCGRCLIQVHACNVSAYTADVLAANSGCQVVVGTGRVALFSEYHSRAWHSSRPNLEVPADREVFYRSTPINGKLVKENLGTRYIAY